MAGPSPAPPRSTRAVWLHGPAPDLLLGAGLAYLITIPLLYFAAARGGLSAWSAGLTAGLALLISGPHYGATLLRVYERRFDRQRYVFFSVYATVLLLALLGGGLSSVWLGSLLVTVYVTWSPWHFAGQNYGISLMFLRRRGVAFPDRFKRWLYASFVLSFLLAILSIHRENSALVYAQGVSGYRVYEVLRAGIPMEWVRWLAPALGAAYLFALAAAARELLRVGTLRDLLEPGLLVLTQSMWFALPAIGAMTGAYQLLGLAFAPIWISTAHAVQYLWVTSYYAARSSSPVKTVPFLGRCLLAGALLMVFPAIVFAPGLFGSYTFHYADAAVLVFAIVNIHHFMLDGAVWKLRDGRVANVLLRTAPDALARADESDRPGWLRYAVYGLGGACLTIAAGVSLASWVVRSPTLPLRDVERANRVLNWMGRGDPMGCHLLAERQLQLGRMDLAIEGYRSCVALSRDQLRQPPSADLTTRLASLLLTYQGKNPRSVAEALQLAEVTTRLAPRDPEAFELLARARRASGDLVGADEAVRQAVTLARAAGAEERAAVLERQLGVPGRGARVAPGAGGAGERDEPATPAS